LGSLLKALSFPVLGPIYGVKWIAERVAEQVDHDLYDETAVRKGLMELEQRYELEEMSEEEYALCEEALLERLRLIDEYNKARREDDRGR
jgi:hypothetical protein